MKKLRKSQINCIAKIKKELIYASGTSQIEAKDEKIVENSKKIRKFSGIAYTGGIMIPSWGVPIVIDIKGISVENKQLPQLRDHNTGKVVGHSDSFEFGSTLKISGWMSGSNADTEEVINNADKGYIWQISVGVKATQVRFIKKDEVVKVNGRVFKGQEFYLVEKGVLKENSFTAIGADSNTSSHIAASYNKNLLKDMIMDFAAWLSANGFNESDLSEVQKTKLLAAFNIEMNIAGSEGSEGDTEGDEQVEPVKKTKITAAAKTTAESSVDDVRKSTLKAAAEAVKHAKEIAKLTKGFPDIEAQALENDWDLNKTELEVMRAGRTGVPNVIKSNGIAANDFSQVLQCALDMSAGNEVTEKNYSEKILSAADKNFRNIGMQEAILEIARKNGYSGRANFNANPHEILKSAWSDNGMIKAGFSTVSLAGILSNIANKEIISAFNNVDSAWKQAFKIGSVRDFKTTTRYSLTGDNVFEELAPTGEIKHGGLGEQTYTNQAKTYAKMLSITREMLINDDMSALSEIPRKLARGAGLQLNNIIWAKFKADTSIFNTDNSKLNYISGATTNLSVAGLTAASTALAKQKDPNGQYMNLKGFIILAPVDVETVGLQLINDTTLITGSDILTSNNNPHKGKYKLVTTPYLDASTTAWYLIANPMDIALFEVVFLNNKQTPTIETADADFNQLGIQLRGYLDFGCNYLEYRSGVKSKGAA